MKININFIENGQFVSVDYTVAAYKVMPNGTLILYSDVEEQVPLKIFAGGKWENINF